MATERRTSRGGGNPGGGSSDWLTLGQAATYLGVAQSTVRKWSDGGRLSAFYTPGGHRRFRRGDLDAFLAGSSGGTATAGGKPLVLIVDDDEQLREFVRVNLEMDGYLVREAGSADEGLAALEDEPPTLVLLDVMMPQVDGFRDAAQDAGATRPRLRPGDHVQRQGGRGDRDRAAREGANAFIGKPFDPQALIESTKQLLRRR